MLLKYNFNVKKQINKNTNIFFLRDTKKRTSPMTIEFFFTSRRGVIKTCNWIVDWGGSACI